MGVKEAFISTRPWSFPMTFIVATVGAVYAYIDTGVFNPVLYLLTAIGVVLLHASVNLMNDYFDYKSEVDTLEAPTVKYRPHPIIAGLYSPNAILFFSISYALIGLSIGIYLTLVTDITTLYLGLIGIGLVYAYTGYPINLKYRALGEVEVFLVWGLLISLGAYYVQVQRLSYTVMLVSTPLGLLITAVLLANNLRDIEFDRRSGIKTLPIILGKETGLKIYEFLLYAPYVIIVILALTKIIPLLTLASLITVPKARGLVNLFKKQIPEPADPMTAGHVLQFGIFYLVSMIIGGIFGI
jgi:1,4-dihydroxy-2-naphthoate octaprenyltransferase